jgi:hypothetical protein
MAAANNTSMAATRGATTTSMAATRGATTTSMAASSHAPTGDDRPWPDFIHPSQQPVNIDRELIDFHRTAETGYAQSHPLDRMFTAEDLKKDELTLNNNYMRLIFGGKTSDNDNIQLAYNHSLRQMADTPIEADTLLENMNPDAFVPVGEASKDSMLEAFKSARQYYPNEVVSDAERFLKSRVTHNMMTTTYYGKRLTADGQSLRYNHVRGQNDLLYRPDVTNFHPFENLSSHTFAPNGDGGEVPLDAEAVYGTDPRSVPVNTDSFIPEDDMNDAGLYYKTLFTDNLNNFNPSFVSLFNQEKERM